MDTLCCNALGKSLWICEILTSQNKALKTPFQYVRISPPQGTYPRRRLKCAAKLLLYFELCKKNEKNRKKINTSRAETGSTVFGYLTINEKQHDGLTVLTVWPYDRIVAVVICSFSAICKETVKWSYGHNKKQTGYPGKSGPLALIQETRGWSVTEM